MNQCHDCYVQGDPERRQVQKSIRSPPQSPPPSGGVPYLYKWLCKFHVTLLAKVSGRILQSSPLN